MSGPGVSGDDLTRRAGAGFGWAYATQLLARGIAFAATVALARILAPDQFGQVAFALAVMAYLDVLTDLGVGAALVYRADADDDAVASTAFWTGLLAAALLTGASVAFAPLLGMVAPGLQVVEVFQVLSAQLVLHALGSVHSFKLQRSLDFRRLLAPELAGALLMAAVSIGLAVAGAGLWSLVAGQLARYAGRTLVLWIAVPWRPRLTFSWAHARPMLRYGLGVSFAAFLGEGIRNFDYLIVGAQLGAVALGSYFLAFRLPELVVMSGARVAGKVLFPYYSRLREGQDGAEAQRQVVRGYRRTLRVTALAAGPLGFGIAGLAGPITATLFGPRWEQAAAPMALIAIWAALGGPATVPGGIFKATGRSGFLLATAVVQIALLVPALWVAAAWSVEAVAGAHLAVRILFFTLLTAVTGRMLGTSMTLGWRVVAPPLAVSALLGAGLLGLALLLPPVAALAVGIPASLVAYPLLIRILLPEDAALLARSALGRTLPLRLLFARRALQPS